MGPAGWSHAHTRYPAVRARSCGSLTRVSEGDSWSRGSSRCSDARPGLLFDSHGYRPGEFGPVIRGPECDMLAIRLPYRKRLDSLQNGAQIVRRSRLPGAGLWRYAALVLVGLFGLLACGTTSSGASVVSVRVTRQAGLVVVPALDQTVSDPGTAQQLATDVLALPRFQPGGYLCPVDFGTTYTLLFSTRTPYRWSAVVSVLGCQTVKLSDGRVLRAANTSKLYADLGAALGLPPDELVPRPCPSEAPDIGRIGRMRRMTCGYSATIDLNRFPFLAPLELLRIPRCSCSQGSRSCDGDLTRGRIDSPIAAGA